MLNAYLDDSGTGGGPHCFVAGYVASTERWASYSTKWQDLCVKYIGGKPMKMSRANRKKSGMFVPESGILEFAHCIRDHVEAVIWSAAPEHEIKKALAGIKESTSKDVTFDKFRLCFTGTLAAAISSPRLREQADLMAWTFDQQGGVEFQASIVSAFGIMRERCREDQKHILYAITFADDSQTQPLQAADFLAWHLRRRHADGYGVPDREAFKIITGGNLESMMFVWFYHKLEGLYETAR